MSNKDAPKIEFPCDYPIKIMGEAAEDFQEAMLDIVRQHAPDFCESTVSMRLSRNGRFASVAVTITATGTTQLEAIFIDLKKTGRVQMVL